MRNYIEEWYTINHYRAYNPEEAVGRMELALKELQIIYRNHTEDEFCVIEVEGYECVAFIADEFAPMVLGDTVAPFDMSRNYPVQHIKTETRFSVL